jgi:hypothetical protein
MTTSITSLTEGLSFGGNATVGELTKTTKVAIPEEVRAGLARAANVFAAIPNSNVLPVMFPTDAEAETFKAQVRQYAEDHNLTAGFPKFVDGHMTKDVTDEKTGKITNPAHWVPANKVDPSWNVGRDVHFRFATKRPTSTVDTKTVTVTQAAPATPPATPATPATPAPATPAPATPAKPTDVAKALTGRNASK